MEPMVPVVFPPSVDRSPWTAYGDIDIQQIPSSMRTGMFRLPPTSTTSPVERPALPDGQVYVNLPGPDGQLLQADDVLAELLMDLAWLGPGWTPAGGRRWPCLPAGWPVSTATWSSSSSATSARPNR